jgi:hypothetical protein
MQKITISIGIMPLKDATQRLGLYDAEVSERRAALGAFLDAKMPKRDEKAA